MAKHRIALIPQYMHHFSCIGPNCEDSCCIGWRVTIDAETYKKYTRARDLQLRPLFDKRVTRNRSRPSKENYAKIKMNKDGTCPFLSEDRLCNIQLKLGEDYLSDTCALYPRITNEVNGVIERSGTVSCPEMARLVLLNPDGIEFDEIEEPQNTRMTIANRLDTHQRKYLKQPQQYFWQFRIFTIQVLQNRSYSIAERLIILGLFYQKAVEYVKNENLAQIPQLIASYTNMLEDGTFKESLKNIPGQWTIQLALLKEMADQRFIQGVNHQRYLDCYREMLKGLKYVTGSTFEEIAQQYSLAYEKYYKPFIDEHAYILENYLVNYVFKNLFPFSGFPTMFDNYVMLVVHYSLIKLHLIGIAGFHEKLDFDMVMKLVQSFSRTVEHNPFFLQKLFDLLKTNGYATMAYMSILIKN